PSVAVAVNVIEPSFSDDTSMPLTDHEPELTVAVNGPTVCTLPASDTVTFTTFALSSVVPDALVLAWFASLTASVTVLTSPALALSFFAAFPSRGSSHAASVAVAVNVIVPSFSPDTSIPLTDQ